MSLGSQDSWSNSGPSLEEYLNRSKATGDSNKSPAIDDSSSNLTATIEFTPVPRSPLSRTQIDLTQEADDAGEQPPEMPVHFVKEIATTPATQVRFRIQAKNFFCTWPQCDTPKEEVLERIKSLPNYSHAVVCKENHQDEHGVHLHAFFSLTQLLNTRSFQWLDDLAGKHGDYSAAKNVMASVNYVIKDGDIVFDGFDPHAFVRAKSQKKSPAASLGKKSTSSQAAQRIMEGADLFQLDDEMPGWILMNKRKAQEYISFVATKKARLSLKPWVPLDLDNYVEDWELEVVNWLNNNIKQKRAFKQQQLYLWSDGPNTGKTTLVEQLSDFLSVFTLPKTPYVDGYISGAYDLVVCDEFKSHFTIQFLNEFLQGSKMHLNQKGSGTVKSDNPPMIFLSNLPLVECYRNKSNTGPFEALSSRFLQVQIPRGKKLDVFKTL